jgi:hypothetical protein
MNSVFQLLFSVADLDLLSMPFSVYLLRIVSFPSRGRCFICCMSDTTTHTQRGLNHSHTLCTIAVTTAAAGATSNCAVQNIAVGTHLLILRNSAAPGAYAAATFGLLSFGSAASSRTGQDWYRLST